MTEKPLYNFRLAPEAIWLIVNTVLGTLLVQVLAGLANIDTLPAWDDMQAWLIALGFSAVRTLLGALLAVVTGGQFLSPGQQPTRHT